MVRALGRSTHSPELLCAPGNAGIAADAECLSEVGAEDVEAIVAAATEHEVDLVVVGPEAALVAGVVDALGGRWRARPSGQAPPRPSWRARRPSPRS